MSKLFVRSADNTQWAHFYPQEFRVRGEDGSWLLPGVRKLRVRNAANDNWLEVTETHYRDIVFESGWVDPAQTRYGYGPTRPTELLQNYNSMELSFRMESDGYWAAVVAEGGGVGGGAHFAFVLKANTDIDQIVLGRGAIIGHHFSQAPNPTMQSETFWGYGNHVYSDYKQGLTFKDDLRYDVSIRTYKTGSTHWINWRVFSVDENLVWERTTADSYNSGAALKIDEGLDAFGIGHVFSPNSGWGSVTFSNVVVRWA